MHIHFRRYPPYFLFCFVVIDNYGILLNTAFDIFHLGLVQISLSLCLARYMKGFPLRNFLSRFIKSFNKLMVSFPIKTRSPLFSPASVKYLW